MELPQCFLVHGFGGTPDESGIKGLRSWCDNTGQEYAAITFAGHPFAPDTTPACPSEMVSELLSFLRVHSECDQDHVPAIFGYSQGAAIVLGALLVQPRLAGRFRFIFLCPCYHLELILGRFTADELIRIERDGAIIKNFGGSKSCRITREWIADYRTFSRGLGKIPEGTFVLWGQRDSTLPFSEREFFQRSVPEDYFIEIPDASHSFSEAVEISSLFSVLDNLGLPG